MFKLYVILFFVKLFQLSEIIICWIFAFILIMLMFAEMRIR